MNLKRHLILSFFLLKILFIVAQSIPDRQKDTLESYIDKTNKAYEQYNYKNAIKYASTLIDKAKEYNDEYYRFLGYDMMGGIYFESGDSIQGRVYSEKALEIARATKIDSLVAWGALNLGILFSDNKKTYHKAIRFFEESIAINEKNDKLDEVYLIYISLAWTYLDNKQLDEAYGILSKANLISEKQQVDSLDRLYIDLLFGRYYQEKKYYSRAKKQLEIVAKKVDEDSITALGIEVHQNLAKVHNATGDFKNAFLSLEKHNQYEKRAFTAKQVKETEKARAEFDLKQAQIDLDLALKEKEYSDELISKSKSLTTILFASTIILVIALLGFFSFFKTRKKYVNRLKAKNKQLIIAKEKAEKLSKIKTKFLSTVSHELRTPLYGVIGISTLLREDEKLREYEEDLKSLKFSADYLLTLINEVLLLSKVDAEAITLSQTSFELKTLINNIARSFEFSLHENNNKLHVAIDDEIPNLLIGDPVRLSQILMNLVGNAVKFNKNGNIWLKLSLTKISEKGFHKTRFIVEDDGPGIPLDKQKAIFDEFTQVENKNHSYKGTGLGLAIAKKLLKLHKSKIHLKSYPGQGSEFSFTINLEENTSQNGSSESNNTLVDEMVKTKLNTNTHILIVDDNKINQKITQKILEKYNTKSSLANDGEQAIAMSRTGNYDLILMDINMPKMNGMEAAMMIRDFDKDIRIIALTAVELEEMREEIMNSGINDIIHKPFNTAEFMKIILKNLSGQQVVTSKQGQ